eukprot:GHVU01219138.1.p1 GENE.GHVU01219138.1~~GHVU01219138.1.p1  ORF type:complete len:560 (+),score=63.86 GHVU01219138.1:1412-3091(+)
MARVSLIIILSALLVAGGKAEDEALLGSTDDVYYEKDKDWSIFEDSWITDENEYWNVKRIVPDGQTVDDFQKIFGQIKGCFVLNQKMSETAPTIDYILEGGPSEGQLNSSQLKKAREAVSECQSSQPQYLREKIIAALTPHEGFDTEQIKQAFAVEKKYLYPDEKIIPEEKLLPKLENIDMTKKWLLSLVNVLTEDKVLEKYDGRPDQISPLSLDLDALRTRYVAAIEYLESADSTLQASIWGGYAKSVIDPPSLREKIIGTASGCRKSSPGEMPTARIYDTVENPLRLVEELVTQEMTFSEYDQLCKDLTSAKCKVPKRDTEDEASAKLTTDILKSARANIWKCTSLNNKDGLYAKIPDKYGKEQFLEVMGKVMIAAPLCQLPASDDGFRYAWDCLVTVVNLKDPHAWLQNIDEDKLQSLVTKTLAITNVEPWWEVKNKLSITKETVFPDKELPGGSSERVYPDVRSQMQATSLVFRLMKVLDVGEPADLETTYKDAIKEVFEKDEVLRNQTWQARVKAYMDPLTLKNLLEKTGQTDAGTSDEVHFRRSSLPTKQTSE